jgi:hypothetical protein
MHPLLLRSIAAEHVRDMQASAAVSRRARWVRRARRGPAGMGRPAGHPGLTARPAFHR